MPVEQWIPALTGLFSMVITQAFRRYVVRLGNFWAAAFALGVAFGIAILAGYLAQAKLNPWAVFSWAILAHEGVSSLLAEPPEGEEDDGMF